MALSLVGELCLAPLVRTLSQGVLGLGPDLEGLEKMGRGAP